MCIIVGYTGLYGFRLPNRGRVDGSVGQIQVKRLCSDHAQPVVRGVVGSNSHSIWSCCSMAIGAKGTSD